ncbi:hypothetical protein CALCODRAFT_544828, partial [Calocera cornea HHB12733]
FSPILSHPPIQSRTPTVGNLSSTLLREPRGTGISSEPSSADMAGEKETLDELQGHQAVNQTSDMESDGPTSLGEIAILSERKGLVSSSDHSGARELFKIEELQPYPLSIKEEDQEVPFDSSALAHLGDLTEWQEEADAPSQETVRQEAGSMTELKRELDSLKDQYAAIEALLREHLNISLGVDKHTLGEQEPGVSKKARR